MSQYLPKALDQVLTEYQKKVVQHVLTGKTNREIAKALSIKEKTIKWHMTNILKTMGLKSRAQLIVACLPRIGYGIDDFYTDVGTRKKRVQ